MSIKKIDCYNNTTTKTKKFPKFMKNKNTGGIGLFIEADFGTMIFFGLGSNRKQGDSLGVIGIVNPSHWKDYNEPLTLQNE